MARARNAATNGPDGRERLLAATIAHLETRSAASLRVTDIAEQADVAIGLIRHHFGSRDGMIAEAQQRRLEGATRTDIDAARRALGKVEDFDTLMAAVLAVTRRTVSRRRAEQRLSRIAAIAIAHGRPDARPGIGATFGDLIDEMAGLIREAQVRDLVRRDLDARALATFMQAYALGMLVHDLDPDAVDEDALVDVVTVALRAILSPA